MDIITYALCKKGDQAIMDVINSMEKLTMVVADEVPTVQTAEPNKLYLVDTNHDNVYEEYVLAEIDGAEQIIALGNIVDFSNFYTKSETDTLLSGKEQVVQILTQSQYNNLTPAQKNEDVIYMVGDWDKRNIYRKNVLYGTTNSENVYFISTNLSSRNVQDAIKELYDKKPGKNYIPTGSSVVKGEVFNDIGTNQASGEFSHAEGSYARASGNYSHAEGITSQASGSGSHAEGSGIASGSRSHAEGGSTASGDYSHAEGFGTVASGDYSHTSGIYNDFKTGDLFEIGNGVNSYTRSNIVEVSPTYLNVNGDIKQNGVTIDFSALGDEIEEISDVEYAALVTKDPDKAYFVQGTEDNTRVVIGYDANDNPVYRMELYGCVASAAWEDNVTTAPQLIEPDNQAAGYYAIKTTIYGVNDNTRYHTDNLITGPAPGTAVTLTNNSSYVIDSTGTNLWFKVHTNNTYLNLMKGENSSWISNIRLNGYNVSKFDYEKIPTNIRYIYKNNKLYATINANNIVYDNSTSSLTATNVKAAIDELNANITPHTELTQAQYDALQNPDAGTEFFITDASSGVVVSSLESRLTALEMQETVYYVNGVQRIPLYSQNITKVVKVDDNTVDWYFLEPTSQKTYKARVTAQGEGNTRTNPLIIVTEVSS